MNSLAVCINICLPWLVFVGVYGALSFYLHFWRPTLAWLSVVAGVGLAGLCFYVGFKNRMQDQDPMWFTFCAVSILFAVAAATVCGDLNFWFNMQPYYDIDNLNSYPAVNPAREKGQQLMDAGRAYFLPGSHLDMRRTIGFRNQELYCVAPITHGDTTLESYDFWAVGINCCSAVSSDFRCGEYNNPRAAAGLRMMRDDQRPFFRLAVQQAEAAYNIHSHHPLFFEWLQDPVDAMNRYREAGYKYFLLGVLLHFAFNCGCVGLAVMAFSKISRA